MSHKGWQKINRAENSIRQAVMQAGKRERHMRPASKDAGRTGNRPGVGVGEEADTKVENGLCNTTEEKMPITWKCHSGNSVDIS